MAEADCSWRPMYSTYKQLPISALLRTAFVTQMDRPSP